MPTGCPICLGGPPEPRFRVAFPAPGPAGRQVWPLREEPGVPHWVIAHCPSCGVRFPDPLPTSAEIQDFYARQQQPSDWELEHYVNIRDESVATWADTAEKLTRLNGGPGRALEVGCAAGHLLQGLVQHRWDVLGVEASPKFSAEVKRRGLPVHEGVLATLPPQAAPFDVVAMFDVLEHLQDPVADLVLSRRLLRPDGRLVLATCDIGSFAARWYGLAWRHLLISHTFYWTRRALEAALGRAGFEVVDVSSVRYWDPEPARERRELAAELGKLGARKTLQRTWMPLARRSARLRDAQARLTRGRLDFPRLEHKVGDQAAVSDVILVVARPAA
jgi:SAM-dependent methyltransferase